MKKGFYHHRSYKLCMTYFYTYYSLVHRQCKYRSGFLHKLAIGHFKQQDSWLKVSRIVILTFLIRLKNLEDWSRNIGDSQGRRRCKRKTGRLRDGGVIYC